MWVVPKAKHNRCRESAPEAYGERLRDFFRRSGPRRASAPAAPSPITAAVEPLPAALAAPLATPISH